MMLCYALYHVLNHSWWLLPWCDLGGWLGIKNPLSISPLMMTECCSVEWAFELQWRSKDLKTLIGQSLFIESEHNTHALLTLCLFLFSKRLSWTHWLTTRSDPGPLSRSDWRVSSAVLRWWPTLRVHAMTAGSASCRSVTQCVKPCRTCSQNTRKM